MARQLHHLTGLRFVCILCIVLFHYFGQQKQILLRSENRGRSDPESFLDVLGDRLVRRGSWAVCWFVTLSGFVTHWAQGVRSPGWGRGLVAYYVKRTDRVLLITWLSMALDHVLIMFSVPPLDMPASLYAACYLQVAPWLFIDPPGQLSNCPNGAAWYVQSVLWSWLLYPLLFQRLICAAAARFGTRGLVGLALGALALAFSFSFGVYVSYGWSFPAPARELLHFSPAGWFPDFLFGSTMAALAADGTPLPACVRKYAGVLADVMAVAFLTTFVCPLPPSSWLPLAIYNHMMLPVIGIYLFGSSAGPSAGFFGGFLAPAVSVSLGRVALEVYLLHIPLNHAINLARGHTSMDWLSGVPIAEATLAGALVQLVVLWWVSAACSAWLTTPFTSWLRPRVAAWARRGAGADGGDGSYSLPWVPLAAEEEEERAPLLHEKPV